MHPLESINATSVTGEQAVRLRSLITLPECMETIRNAFNVTYAKPVFIQLLVWTNTSGVFMRSEWITSVCCVRKPLHRLVI